MNLPPKPQGLPRRRVPLPALESIAEPDGDRFIKIVRPLADAALVVVRNGNEVSFLAAFGQHSGVVSMEKADHSSDNSWVLSYKVAGASQAETWMTGPESDVRKVFDRFANYAGTGKIEDDQK